MIKINVDNKEIVAEQGQMLIDAADGAGIAIPRFCYHPKLSVAANCRMCLVEVAGLKKPVPACATAVSDGMVVHTQSNRTKQSQQAVMEFLLINHPLDCPICDQGGECELQDVAMGYGQDVSRFTEQKRVVEDKDIGPLIHTDLTRCIHCTRCVRFGQEIAGIKELGMCGRGEHSEISSFLEKSIDSEMSGNVIDVCPVGALTSKPFRYSARSWEIVSRKTIAANDSSGSNMYCHIKNNQIKRVVPAQNDEINEVWLSDKDRFSYEGVNSPKRLVKPMVKVFTDYWEQRRWEEILPLVVELLQEAGKDIVTIVSPNCTLEEMYLAQKLTRALGSNHIDHRISQKDFGRQDKWADLPKTSISLSDIEQSDSAFIIGSDLCYEHPMVSHRLRKVSQRFGFKDSRVWQLNETEFSLRMSSKCLLANKDDWIAEIATVLKCVLEIKGVPESSQRIGDLGLDGLDGENSHKALAKQLLDAKNPLILLGNLCTEASNFEELIAWSQELSLQVEGNWIWLPPYANSLGGWVSGCVPHRAVGGEIISSVGDDCAKMQEKKYQVAIGIGVEFGIDITVEAENVIALTTHHTETLNKHADIILPMACIEETAGTLLNMQGDWQSFSACANPSAEVKSGWKILRVLGNFLNLEGFEYTSSKQIHDELRSFSNELNDSWNLEIASPFKSYVKKEKEDDFYPVKIEVVEGRETPVELKRIKMCYHRCAYDDNIILRNADSLQQSKYVLSSNRVFAHPKTIKQLGNITVLTIEFDDEVDKKSVGLEVVANDCCAEGILSLPEMIRVYRPMEYDEDIIEYSYRSIGDVTEIKVEGLFSLDLSSDVMVLDND
jgi:NADH-quinone oxidoreductase subunit G